MNLHILGCPEQDLIISQVTLAKKFCHTFTNTQTGSLFSKIVKSCTGRPKTCKPIKNRKSKICTKPILSSTYIEESKKELKTF